MGNATNKLLAAIAAGKTWDQFLADAVGDATHKELVDDLKAEARTVLASQAPKGLIGNLWANIVDDAIETAYKAHAGSTAWKTVLDQDFAAESDLDVTGGSGDGTYVLDSGASFRFLNSTFPSNNVEIVNGTGLRLVAAAGAEWIPTNTSGDREGPQASVRLDSLDSTYHPFRHAVRIFARVLLTDMDSSFEGVGLGVHDNEGASEFLASTLHFTLLPALSATLRHSVGGSNADSGNFPPSGSGPFDNLVVECGNLNRYVTGGVLDNATPGNLSTNPADYQIMGTWDRSELGFGGGTSKLTTTAEAVIAAKAFGSGDSLTVDITRLVVQLLDLGAPT